MHYYNACQACMNMWTRHRFRLTYEDRRKLDAEPWCQICGTQEDLQIDHCHETNVIRGYLCREHNTGIARFNDNITELLMAIDYLTPYETTN